MDKISVVGLDLAKNVFQVHAVNAQGRVVERKQLRRSEVLVVVCKDRTLPDWAGSLWRHALLGTQAERAGAYGAADGGKVHQTLFEVEQVGYARCGSHL